jgi:nucleotide-binding universal stress UspA family protein
MNLKRILVPTDLSEASGRALESAKALADRFGASLHVLTVIPEPFVLPNPGPWYVPSSPGYLEGLRRDADAHLQALVTSAEREKFRVELPAVFGEAAAAIVDYATRASIDMIVMGTHGRGGLAHAMLGSVAEKVVRTAPCPVLTVR